MKTKAIKPISVLLTVLLSLAALPAQANEKPKDLLVGDVNRNGMVDIGDVTSLQRYLAEQEAFDEQTKTVAKTDFSTDELSVNDASVIQMYLAEYDTAEAREVGRAISVPSFDESIVSYNSFTVELLKNCLQNEKSTLVSPISVLSVFGMTANGADGKTLSELETAFGMSAEELNLLIKRFRDGQDDGYTLINNANSLWLNTKTGLEPEQVFINKADRYYGASVFSEPFTIGTPSRINRWVNVNTNGIIKRIVDRIDTETAAALLNTIYFKADWEHDYLDWSSNVYKGNFTKEDGSKTTMEMMQCTEKGHSYLRGKNAEGFIKHYEGRKYGFAALLPDKGMTVSEYLDSLTGSELTEILQNAADTKVESVLPKFSSQCDLDLTETMKRMGVEAAFSPGDADFSRLTAGSSDNNAYIGKALHKTHIDFNEKGTEAAAATYVALLGALAPEPEEIRYIILDRPFVYMIVDFENNMPLFIGAYTGD